MVVVLHGLWLNCLEDQEQTHLLSWKTGNHNHDTSLYGCSVASLHRVTGQPHCYQVKDVTKEHDEYGQMVESSHTEGTHIHTKKMSIINYTHLPQNYLSLAIARIWIQIILGIVRWIRQFAWLFLDWFIVTVIVWRWSRSWNNNPKIT